MRQIANHQWLLLTAGVILAAVAGPAAVPPQDEQTALPPGTIQTHPIDGLPYAWVPPGQFQMGCVPGDSDCDADEKPRRAVTITSGFWMGTTEVTVAAYEAYVTATGTDMPPAPDINPVWKHKDHPVVRIQWTEAVAFCEWAGGRLPSEAEYEYAARGGHHGLKFPWGLSVSHEDANYRGSEGSDHWDQTVAPVGSFPANRYGLHDLAGNVWEWIADWYQPTYYAVAPAADPSGPEEGVERVLRGGSWFTVERVLRASDRYKYVEIARDSSVGFRCVLDRLPP